MMDDVSEWMRGVDADSVAAALRRRHPDVELFVRHRDSSLRLVLIRVPEDARGNGKARAAMRDLLAAADHLGLRVTLTPEPLAGDRRTSKRRLTAWYRSLGFVRNRGKHQDSEITDAMYREPVDNRQP